MRARLRYVAAAVALSAGLAACGGDDAPEGAPAPSASTSASASAPAPATPEMPDEARGTGPEAAEAFVRHYVDLINYAIRTLETRPLRTASSNGCEACSAMAKAADRMRARGLSYEGGAWSIASMQELAQQGSQRQIRAVIDVDEMHVMSPNGAREAVAKHRTQFTFDVMKNRGRWTVLRMVGVAQ